MYEDDPPTGTGNGSSDQEKMRFWAYLYNTQREGSHTVVAVLTSHTLAFKYAARKRTIANRATVAKILVCPMTSGKSTHSMTLNDSSVSTPFCTSDNVNQLSGLENLRDRQFTPNFIIINISYAEFT